MKGKESIGGRQPLSLQLFIILLICHELGYISADLIHSSEPESDGRVPTVGRKSLSGLNARPVALQPSATYKTEPMETRIGICCRWLFLFQTGGVGGGVSLANVSRRASANSGVCFTYPGQLVQLVQAGNLRLAAHMWEAKVEATATGRVDA